MIDRIDIFYIDSVNGWCALKLDANGDQLEDGMYYYHKRQAISAAKEYGVPVYVFRKDGDLQRVIRPEGKPERMFEFSFTLPPASTSYIKKWLAREYGGYTYNHVIGGWINGDGELVEDHMVRYLVAAPVSKADAIRKGALAGALVEEQEALYFVGVDGPEIIDVGEAMS